MFNFNNTILQTIDLNSTFYENINPKPMRALQNFIQLENTHVSKNFPRKCGKSNPLNFFLLQYHDRNVTR